MVLINYIRILTEVLIIFYTTDYRCSTSNLGYNDGQLDVEASLKRLFNTLILYRIAQPKHFFHRRFQ